MSANQPSIHPDWLQPPPKPEMSTAAKVFVGLGIAGGLVSLTACAAVIMGLMQRAEMADVGPVTTDEHIARVLQPPQAEPSKQPVVLRTSEDRTAAPPEEPPLDPKPQDAEAIRLDRTKVTVQARFVELDLAVARKLAGRQDSNPGAAGGGGILDALAGAKRGEAATALNEAKPADVAAALEDLQRRGVARVLVAPRVTTPNRLPARIVEEGKSAAGGDAVANGRPRPYTVTLQCVPVLLDRENVSLEVSTELLARDPGPEADAAASRHVTAVTTRVKIGDGQTLAIGGMASESSGGGREELVILLTAALEPPTGLEALTPLGEAEVRDRCQRQCRFVQEELSRQFPESKVTLVPAAGKLFVRGTTKDERQREQIVAAVRRRAEQLQIVACPGSEAAPAGDEPVAAADSNVVDMLRAPLAPQVVIRMKLFEMEHKAAAEATRDVTAATTDEGRLLKTLLGLADSRRSAVLDGLEAGKLEAALKDVGRRGLVRVLSEPSLVTLSGRKATMTLGGDVSLPEGAEGRDAPGDKLRQYSYGTIIDTVPVVLDDGRIRVEVTPNFRKVVEDGRASNPPRLVLASQAVTAVAVIRSGQTLAVAGLPGGDAAKQEDQPQGETAAAGAQQFLLVTAEVVRPAEVGPALPVAHAVKAGPDGPPAATAALPSPVTSAVPPQPAGHRSLREFFRKADQADYEEKVERPGVYAQAGRLARPSPPLTRETVALAEIRRAGELVLQVDQTRALLADARILRTAAVDPAVCHVAQSAAREITVTGKAPGSTHLRLWFEDSSREPVSLRVRVRGSDAGQQGRQEKVRVLEEVLAELFPQSDVQLRLAADRLAVEGRARDAAEAAQIMAVVRGQVPALESPAEPVRVIDRLRTTEAETVALRVKILELNPEQIRNSPEYLQPRSPDAGRLARSLVELGEKGGHVVLDPAAYGDVAAGIRGLAARRLLRVRGEPVLMTQSERSVSLTATEPTEGALGGKGTEAAAPPGRAAADGPAVTLLPVVLGSSKVRLEFGRELGPSEQVPPFPGIARPVTGAAELAPGSTLAIADPFDASGARAKAGRRGTTLIVLVTPELARPVPAKGEASTHGPAKSAGRVQPGAAMRTAEPVSTPRTARAGSQATPPAAAGRPGAGKAPSLPGFDVAESPGPAPNSGPSESQPAEAGGLHLPKVLDRLKSIRLPFQAQPQPAKLEQPPMR